MREYYIFHVYCVFIPYVSDTAVQYHSAQSDQKDSKLKRGQKSNAWWQSRIDTVFFFAFVKINFDFFSNANGSSFFIRIPSLFFSLILFPLNKSWMILAISHYYWHSVICFTLLIFCLRYNFTIKTHWSDSINFIIIIIIIISKFASVYVRC